ncbi:MAG TPA: pyruvate, phosphate dikinase [Chthonomonadales bacterium]|nr:pyruvate, phosphate dikinase [Chthonomonadales bacterium]
MGSPKRVYLFREGNAAMKDLLGGKGANLAEMTNIGLVVPPGFTITTAACNEYSAAGGRMPDGLMDEVKGALAAVEAEMGKTLGDPANPLLVSVRSGAKFSMPGMMDTVLNLGLTSKSRDGLIRQTGNERFVYDAHRRLIMMFSDIVLDVPRRKFEDVFDAHKEELGVKLDTDVPAPVLKVICDEFLALSEKETGRPFPDEPIEQLTLAIEAVFRSWNNDRARIYREREKISHDLGTAVNVQCMVFGNMGEDSGTGVAFTRDMATGEKVMYGEYLMNAQGEDVVAGLRTPVPISELKKQKPEIYAEFDKVATLLENHYRDSMDLEFTIENNKLFILQCRVGKRTAGAAVRIAVEMVNEGLITKEEAVQRVRPEDLDQLLHPMVDPKAKVQAIAKGLAASPGAAVGKAVFDSHDAARIGAETPMILVRPETNPDDIRGMVVSKGILTARGGMTSHAAVVARGFGLPCVAGCEAIVINEHARTFTAGDVTVSEGDWISIDGSTGRVILGQAQLIEPEITPEFETLLGWADGIRTLGVRANADNPNDAAKAFEYGAEGIGLCRTEHMFFERDRLPIVQDMILASTDADRQSALDKLLPVQQTDFEGIFEAMQGRPVTIRLIDPPLHEFLPRYEEVLARVVDLKARGVAPGSPSYELLEKQESLLAAIGAMREVNPMLGMRGCRLSIVFPQIVEMQVRAIFQAACALQKKGIPVHPEVMIPLVSHVNELSLIQEKLEGVAKQVMAEQGVTVDYMFGTMIEIPRAALTADEIAKYTQFFSFGTNDLTQTTFGFSRDDAESKFLQRYVDQKILESNPFEQLDQVGVGKLMKMSVDLARSVRPDIKLGICGEHGGDPSSITFCHNIGLHYVSCSPFRVPIARLAAAQAAATTTVERDK